MGSWNTFEAIVKASAAANNAHASRAYYPPLNEECKVQPMRPMLSKRGWVVMYEDMCLHRALASRDTPEERRERTARGSTLDYLFLLRRTAEVHEYSAAAYTLHRRP